MTLKLTLTPSTWFSTLTRCFEDATARQNWNLYVKLQPKRDANIQHCIAPVTLTSWPHDLQIQGWPTCYQDVPAYQNDVSGSRLSKIRAWKGQTDRHTYRDANQRLQCCVNSYRPRELISLAGKVTAGMVESNGSLPPGLWLMSSVDWLPRNQDQLRVQRL